MNNILRTALVSGFIALLCACGAKGSLFMPEEAPPVELPEPAEAEPEVEEAPEAQEEPEEAATPSDDAG